MDLDNKGMPGPVMLKVSPTGSQGKPSPPSSSVVSVGSEERSSISNSYPSSLVLSNDCQSGPRYPGDPPTKMQPDEGTWKHSLEMLDFRLPLGPTDKSTFSDDFSDFLASSSLGLSPKFTSARANLPDYVQHSSSSPDDKTWPLDDELMGWDFDFVGDNPIHGVDEQRQ